MGSSLESNFEAVKITNEYSNCRVHKWRSEEDAILVGLKTAIHDNPRLTTRKWTGRNPVRVLLDRYCKVEGNNLLDGEAPTLIYNLQKDEVEESNEWIKIEEGNFLESVLEDLNHRKIQSLIVEGGAQTLSLFIQQNLWDEARVLKSDMTLGTGVKSPELNAQLINVDHIANDTLFTYKPIQKLDG